MRYYYILLVLLTFTVVQAQAQAITCPPDNKEQLAQLEAYINTLQNDTAAFNTFLNRVLQHEQYASAIAPLITGVSDKLSQPGNGQKELKELVDEADWNRISSFVCELLVDGGIDELIMSESKVNKALKFLISKDEYRNKDTYHTMYTGKKIKVYVEKVDTASTVKLAKIKWKLNGKEVASMKDSAAVLELTVDKTNLSKETNELIVLDSAGSKLSTLTIKIYYAPIVKFDEGRTFNGEYFFCHGYDFPPLANNTQYNMIRVGKNATPYYAPVLGLLQGQTADIRVDVKDLANAAKSDKSFRVVFKPQRPNIIAINNLDSLVVDGNGLNSLTTISIRARSTINGSTLTPMLIDVYIQSTKEKVGLLEYYCADRIHKTVTLIFTKFNDERSFPNYFTIASLQTALNTNSMNQLFMEFTVDTLQLTVRNHATTAFNSYTNEQILDSLNNAKFGVTRAVPGYSSSHDYFYITNLEIPGASANSWKGGFHYTGGEGGVQVKFRRSSYSETAEEMTVHEFGHWMGLPHTWASNSYVSVVIAGSAAPTGGGLTKDSYMDYNIQRKKWFKIQLLHNRR